MKRRGFTLLEVLVATVIMAAAVVALLSNLSTSLQNAGRLSDYDRAVMMAKRTMEELLAEPNLPKRAILEGEWDPALVGVAGGWKALVTPFERQPGAGPGALALDRLELEVWWMNGDRRRVLNLETYRAAPLRQDDMPMLGRP
ncbi:MAG: prepilin-type N-terminal cleavage/methylation domain-containing protein [Bryobacteraceae bacterium]|nr:prepilin-type N-terminal cleavage/methylation domain-containing protein [Bryobacteraceae bacterium]